MTLNTVKKQVVKLLFLFVMCTWPSLILPHILGYFPGADLLIALTIATLIVAALYLNPFIEEYCFNRETSE